MGTAYTILREEGTLNVYRDDEKTFEIQRENGRFKVVYDAPQGSLVLKIREKYQRFSFWPIKKRKKEDVLKTINILEKKDRWEHLSSPIEN